MKKETKEQLEKEIESRIKLKGYIIIPIATFVLGFLIAWIF